MDLKRSGGRLFAVLDGGINNLGIRQMLYRTFEPRVEGGGPATDAAKQLLLLTLLVLPMLSIEDVIFRHLK